MRIESDKTGGARLGVTGRDCLLVKKYLSWPVFLTPRSFWRKPRIVERHRAGVSIIIAVVGDDIDKWQFEGQLKRGGMKRSGRADLIVTAIFYIERSEEFGYQ
ncbi:MAG TPA: hypothetical protein VN647_01805 [Nitrospira sp.]|nr:hypothetical protein [Nitrospira sp.]